MFIPGNDCLTFRQKPEPTRRRITTFARRPLLAIIQNMKIRIILIQVVVVLTMTNVFCQQNEEKRIFEEQKDMQVQKKYNYSDQLGRYLIKENLPDYKIIEQDGKLGVLNKSGDVLINPFVKGKIEHEPNGFMIKHNNLYGFYDLEGNKLLAHKYKALFPERQIYNYCSI